MTKLNVHAAVQNVTGEFAFGSVCADCESVLANGDLGGRHDWRNQDILQKNCEAYEFTLGHIHYGKWADDRCYHVGFDCIDDDCTCQTVNFDVFNHCDMCGDASAGYRSHVIMIKRELLNTSMTQEQFDKLRGLCDRYNVDMSIGDYLCYGPNATMMIGWCEGWLGGVSHNGMLSGMKKTLYVGVSPEGDSHS